MDPSKLLDSPKPDGVKEGEMLSIQGMFRLLEQKRLACRYNIGIQPVVLRRGFLDTSKGLTLTSDEAMALIERGEAGKKSKHQEAETRKAAAAARNALQYAKRRKAREEMDLLCAKRRAQLFGESFRLPRPFAVRRALAAKKAAEKREVAATMAQMGKSD